MMKNTTKWFFRNKHAVFFLLFCRIYKLWTKSHVSIEGSIGSSRFRRSPMKCWQKEVQSYLQQGLWFNRDVDAMLHSHQSHTTVCFLLFNVLFIHCFLNKFLPSFMCFENILGLITKNENMLGLSTRTPASTELCVDNTKDRSNVIFDSFHVCSQSAPPFFHDPFHLLFNLEAKGSWMSITILFRFVSSKRAMISNTLTCLIWLGVKNLFADFSGSLLP